MELGGGDAEPDVTHWVTGLMAGRGAGAAESSAPTPALSEGKDAGCSRGSFPVSDQ